LLHKFCYNLVTKNIFYQNLLQLGLGSLCFDYQSLNPATPMLSECIDQAMALSKESSTQASLRPLPLFTPMAKVLPQLPRGCQLRKEI
jgi:hypothetical protein